MQVPQVTEQVALAVIELYPTVLSLAQAYSMLVSPLQGFQVGKSSRVDKVPTW
jgi:hypothetical protein